MPAFRFTGDPRHGGEGPEAITLFGLTFGRAAATEVTDAAVVRKLAANPHFARHEGAQPEETPAPPPHKKARRNARQREADA